MPEITAAPAVEQPPRSPALAISDQLVKLFAVYVGHGPTRARTVITPDLVVVSLSQIMTRAEQHLVAAGEADAVRSMRRTFHCAIRQDAIRAVTETLDRRIVAYMADVDVEADVAIVAFVVDQAE